MKTPVKDHSGWYRDANGAISCADSSTYEKYMKAHKAEKVKKQEFEALQNDVSLLKSDMSEIKSLLQKLANN